MANIILGTIDADELFGTELDDDIRGLAGDDTIVDDEAGNDIIDAGDGLNVVEAGIGDDFVIAGIDDDTLLGEEGNDEIYGGDGLDQLFGGDGNDTIYGQEGDDTIDGEFGDDILLGDAGADIMTGGFGSDFISGGEDADILNSHSARVNTRVVEKDEFYLGGGTGIADEVNLFTNYLGGTASTRPKTDGSKAIVFDFNKTDDTLNLLDAASRYTIRASGNFYGSRRADTLILRGSNTVAVIVDQTLASADLGQVGTTPAPTPVV